MRMAMIGLRLHEATLSRLKVQVEEEGSTISEYVRKMLEKAAVRQLPPHTAGHDGDGTDDERR